MSTEQRSSIENGIWMCGTHAKLIDGDQTRFTVLQLREMKRLAEVAAQVRIGQQLPSPTPPRFAPARPQVRWESFYVLPTEGGQRSNTFIRLVALPVMPRPLAVDGISLALFIANVERDFGDDAQPPATSPQADCHDLVWHSPAGATSRHWRQGQDGSLGFAATIESGFSPGAVSLWDVALDCIQFLRFLKHNLECDLVLEVDFQPGPLRPTSSPLAPADAHKVRLAGLPPLVPADPHSRFGAIQEFFDEGELSDPFSKLAAMLANRWRVMFNVTAINPVTLAQHFKNLAAAELGWRT